MRYVSSALLVVIIAKALKYVQTFSAPTFGYPHIPQAGISEFPFPMGVHPQSNSARPLNAGFIIYPQLAPIISNKEETNPHTMSSDGPAYPMRPCKRRRNEDDDDDDRCGNDEGDDDAEKGSAEQENGPVQKVNQQNYEKTVARNNKDVALFFHVTGCGYCVKMLPKFNKLAKHFQSNKKLLFAKYHADPRRNNLPKEFKNTFKGYPVIVYVHGDTKQYELYYGDQTFDELVEMIKYELKQ